MGGKYHPDGRLVRPHVLRYEPITSQLAAILERRRTAAQDLPEAVREWVFSSPTSPTGHVQDPHHLYARIGKTGGAKFWFHGVRNSFITVAERELMLPPSLTKRLVDHARPNDVTQRYTADWTIAQLREAARRIADRIEALIDRRHRPWMAARRSANRDTSPGPWYGRIRTILISGLRRQRRPHPVIGTPYSRRSSAQPPY